MQRASITIKIERSGKVLAEHTFGQDEPNLDDLREMFMSSLFQRMQKLGNDVFDMADASLEKLLEEERTEKKKAAEKKKATEQKPAGKTRKAVKPKESEGESSATADDGPSTEA